MSNVKTFTDPEGVVRDWLKAQSISGLASRVFLGLPERCTYPAADVQLLDGGILEGVSPVADVRFTCSIWGGARIATAAAAWALASTVENLTSGTALGDDLVAQGGRVTLGPLFRPDPDDNRARYLVDFAITVRPTT